MWIKSCMIFYNGDSKLTLSHHLFSVRMQPWLSNMFSCLLTKKAICQGHSKGHRSMCLLSKNNKHKYAFEGARSKFYQMDVVDFVEQPKFG